MNELTIRNENGIYVVDSREVAEWIGKEHKNLLRDIGNYSETITQSTSSDLSALDFFIPNAYTDAKNENRNCYLLTKKGCDMVANKMTGEKGILFTAAYVTKFAEMEKVLKDPYQSLSKELKAIFCIDQNLQVIESRVEKLENNMTIDYAQQLSLQKIANQTAMNEMGGKSSLAYQMIGSKIFKSIWHDYKIHFNIDSYKNTSVVDFERGKTFLMKWKATGDIRLMIIGANTGTIQQEMKV